MNRHEALDRIADAILDGTAIDWSIAERADASIEPALLAELRTLAAVRRMTRGATTDAPGEWTWGHLRVLEQIGFGAFGDVYRAWDTRLDREVALKLIRESEQPEGGAVGTVVIKEGRLLARVRHPNVATIYGAEHIDGRSGLWMEFVHGRTLEEALRDGRTFTPADVTALGVTLCRAVAAVHAAGLLHRDIKAQNVMIADDDGRLVLMDFGTGLELADATGTSLAGTPLYLAPEVLAGAAASRRSDVYSIGVLLFRLSTGTYPVSARTLADLREAHATRGATAALDHPAMPRRLRRMLARALDPDPARRFGDAGAFGDALSGASRPLVTWRTAAIAAGLVAALWGGWQLGWSHGPGPQSAAAASDTPTLVVLPFTNVGTDPDNELLVDGLTSDVIRHLASLDGLAVTSMTSSFFFKDRERDLRDVSRRLPDADYAVEATVQRAGSRLRVNAQLVRIPTGVAVWSKSFDRSLDDVLAIQDEIALAVVNNLRLTLGRGQRSYRTNAQAWELYLRGRAIVNSRLDATEAVQIFEQVIALDGTFAPAYAGLVESYARVAWRNVESPSYWSSMAAMRPTAERALELDPRLPEAHAAMGMVYARDLQWHDAERAFQHALTLPGDLAPVRVWYAFTTLLPQGDVATALEVLEMARREDPLSLLVKREIGIARHIAGRHDEAERLFREVMEVDPEFSGTANLLSRTLTFSGRPEEAIALWESRRWPGDWERWVISAYVKAGRDVDVKRLVEAHRNETPYRQALIFAALGDKDRTFEALDRAADPDQRPQRTAALLFYPEMALLQGDLRLDELRRKLNLR